MSQAIKQTNGPAQSSMQRKAMAVGGFSCLYALAIVFFYSDWLYREPDANALTYELCLNSALCIAAIVVALMFRRKAPFRFLWTLGCGLYGAAFVSLAVSSLLDHLAYAYVAGVFAGAAAGVLVPCWFARIGRLWVAEAPVLLGVGSAAASVLALAVGALPSEGVAIAGCLLIAFSTVCLRLSSVERLVATAGELQADSRASGDEHELLESAGELDRGMLRAGVVSSGLYVFLFSVAYGMIDMVTVGPSGVDATLPGFASQIGGVAFDGLFVACALKGRLNFDALLSGALIAASTALLFLPFAPVEYHTFLVVLVHGGWGFALLVWYCQCLSRRGDGLFAVAALSFAAPRPGLMLGAIVARALTADGILTFTRTTLIVFILLYLIVGGIMVLRDREGRIYRASLRQRDEIIKRYIAARKDFRELACEQIAKEKSLTARERELLFLYAQGRDAAYVERTLFLSRNTVKSYAKSLYAKIGVHSKQELIALVDDIMHQQESLFYEAK